MGRISSFAKEPKVLSKSVDAIPDVGNTEGKEMTTIKSKDPVKESTLTVELLSSLVPKHLKSQVKQSLIDTINNSIKDPEHMAYYRENVIGLTSVLSKGKIQLDKYLNAVRYVSFKQMGCTNKDAYIKTFPNKYADFVARGVSIKDISSYYTMYDQTKTVTLVKEQSMIPVYIHNMDIRQQLITKLFTIAMNDNESTRNQIEAGKVVIAETKPPEESKIAIDIGVKQESFIDEFNDAMKIMVQKQKELIAQGGDVKAIANAKIVTDKHDEEDIIDV